MPSNRAVLVVALLAAIAGAGASLLFEPTIAYRLAGTEVGQQVLDASLKARAPAAPAGVTIAKKGGIVPAMTLPDPDGKQVAIPAAWAGRTTLVNLWATWCAPCRHEMPALNRLQIEEGGADFEVVAINVDTGGDEKPKRFLEETGVDALGYYRDATMGVFNELKRRGLALGLPVTVLVDAGGCMIAHMNGPAEWASADARALIAAVR